MRSRFRFHSRYLLVLCAVTLSLLGLVFIYSASGYEAELTYGDAFFYVKKQAISFAAGIVCLIAARFLKPKILRKGRVVILLFSLVSLGLVFIPGLGVESYGATRWINLGFTTVQPSEIAKFGLMIYLASYLDAHPPTRIRNLIPPLLIGASTCLLIMAEPNMSVTVCVGACVFLTLFVSGGKKRWFLPVFLLVAAAIPVLILLEPYRVKRIVAFLDPWQNPLGEGYQLIQSYYAIGNGGLFGVGLFRSRQKYLFLPFSESDFIFSVIAEETGLFGCIVVLMIFALYVLCGIRVSMRAKSRFDALLSFALTSVVAVQTLLNVAVVTGSVPPTGLPLPFVSAGGTSLVAFLFSTGLLYGVAKRNDETFVPELSTRTTRRRVPAT